MRRIPGALVALFVAACVVAACEPTEPPAFARRSTAPATARPTVGTSAPASGGPTASAGASGEATPQASGGEDFPTGSPRIEIEGTSVKIVGQSEKNTAVFALDGTYNFETSACPGTGVIPFVWVYEEFGQSRGTYVDATFTVKNLKGNLYLRVAGPPNCNWTVTLTKQ